MPRKTQIDVADWFEITWLCVTESAQKSLAPIIRPIRTWLKKRCLPIEGKIWERWTTSWWTPICTITSTTSTLTASTALRFCQSGNFSGDYCSVSQTPTVTWHTITSVRCILADSAGLPNRPSRHMGPAFLGPRYNDDVILAESYGQALLNWSRKIENMHQVKETKTTLKPLYSKCKVSQMNPHDAVYYRR